MCAVLLHLTDRQMVKILVEIDRVLHPVLVDLLPEVAVAIEQTDSDKLEVKVAGRFAMIACEDAQAARIIRHRFMKTKLGGEIGHRFFHFLPHAGCAVGSAPLQVFAKAVMDLLPLAQESLVLSKFLQAALAG